MSINPANNAAISSFVDQNASSHNSTQHAFTAVHTFSPVVGYAPFSRHPERRPEKTLRQRAMSEPLEEIRPRATKTSSSAGTLQATALAKRVSPNISQPDLSFSPVIRRMREVALQKNKLKKLEHPDKVLTPEEKKSINSYTSSTYVSINMRLRAGIEVPEYELIRQGLEKLAAEGYRYDEKTYRGISGKSGEGEPSRNLYPENQTVLELAPLSTTYSYDVALLRAKCHGNEKAPERNGVLVQLIADPDPNNSKSGVDITGISQIPKEYEVLHPAGKKMEILLNAYSSKEGIHKVVARDASIPAQDGSAGFINSLLLA